MKRFLSIFLALTMILAMMPTTFAAVDKTTAVVTYNFYRDSPELVEHVVNKLIIIEDPSGNKSFTDYGIGRDWAYLGTNANGYASSRNDAVVDIFTSLRLGSGNQNDWVAFKIRVPETGKYDVNGTILINRSYTTMMDVYIAPLTGDIATTFSNPETYGTVSAGARTGGKSFTELGIADYKLGRVNCKASSSSLNGTVTEFSVTHKGTVTGTELLSVKLDKNTEYVLVFNQASADAKDMTPVSLTLTPNKTHNYIFNRSVLAEDNENNTALAGNGYKMFYLPTGETYYTGNYLDSYDNVNKNLTDEWCASLLGGRWKEGAYRKEMSALLEQYLAMVTRKDLTHSISGAARFVLKLKVNYDGIYDVTADVSESNYGTDADVYMIKATEDVTEITPDVLKNYKSIGRVGNVAGRPDGDIGAAELTAGDWYMVFDFNTTNETEAKGSRRQELHLKKLNLTEIDALPESGATPEDVKSEDVPEISFSATTSIPDKANVTINNVQGNLKVLTPSRGDKISVSAPEVPGYKFIGWKEGSANDTGDGELANTAKFVKELGQEGTFTVYTSTFLTAVYEEAEPDESADSIVEFWNLDGSYLGSKTIDKINEEGGLPTTSLIGHTFTGWLTAENTALDIAGIVEKVTHAVASYTADATLAATDVDCVSVNGTTREDANAYGKEVICEDNGTGTVTHWLRDGKVVSYDPTYKYYVWDATNISSSYAPIEKKPLVVLDGDTVSGAYMIEYDKGIADAIVEVGILFGTGTPTIESKSEIFKSQRGDNHGQFAAKPTNSAHTARGYMIYKEDGSYKVIYSE